MTPLSGVPVGQFERARAVGQEAGVGLAGVEALQLPGERGLRRGLRLGREGLVVRVIADDPGIVLEPLCHRLPHEVEVALEVPHHVVGPEVCDRRLQRRVRVVVRPPTTLGHNRDVVGADRPIRGALAPEVRVVHVLMHVEQRVDPVSGEQVDRGLHVVQIGLGHRLVPFVRIAGCSRRADLRLVRAA